MRRPSPTFALLSFILVSALGGAANAQGVTSPWTAGHGSKVRLLAGWEGEGAARRLVAGVEIALDTGWKTYWRSPGDSGIPPRFDFSGSTNLAAAEVAFPAPQRFPDALGETIGYKSTVTFPVAVTLQNAGRPIAFKVLVSYGICKDICVPGEAALTLDVPSDVPLGLPPELAAALDKTPRSQLTLRPGDPLIVAVGARIADSGSPVSKVTIGVIMPEGTVEAEAFLEGPDGALLPRPVEDPAAALTGRSQGKPFVFETDLSQIPDVATLKDKIGRVTIVTPTGSSETMFVFK